MSHLMLWNSPEDLKEAARALHAPVHDPARVNVGNDYEVRRWCQRLRCAESTLRQVVQEVGEDPTKVREGVDRTR